MTARNGTAFMGAAMPDEDWWRILWPDPAAVLDRLAGPGAFADRDVVDLCCGNGLFTMALARAARRVVAIDVDRRLLDRLEASAAAAGLANIVAVEGDALDVATLVDPPADTILLANTLHGAPDGIALGRAIAGALRADGELLVINWYKLPRAETTVLDAPRGPADGLRMRPADVAATLAPAGFVVGRVVELPPFHYGVVLGRAASS